MPNPDTGRFTSSAGDIQLHDSGWIDIPSGVEITRLPTIDDRNQLYAHTGWQVAADWCEAHSPSPRPSGLVMVLGAIFGWWLAAGGMWQPLRNGKPSMFHSGEPGYGDYATMWHVVRVGGKDGYYRLPTPAEYQELHDHELTLHIEPFPLPTREMVAAESERQIAEGLRTKPIPYNREHPAYKEYQYRCMQSEKWCRIHDTEGVKPRLRAAGWTDEPVDNAGKKWCLYSLTGDDTAPPSDVPDTDPAPDSGALPEPSEWRTLRRGMDGRDVEAWQLELLQSGYVLDVDGDFGPETDDITREFQRDRELNPDGIVGRRTRAAIGTPPVPRPDPVPEPVIVTPGDDILPDPMQMLQAVNYTKGPRSQVHQILLHCTENPPIDDRDTVDPSDDIARPWVALGVARWGQGKDWRGRPTKPPRASWHAVIGGDPEPYNGVIQCVKTEDIAWTAGVRAVNNISINYEMIGETYKTDWDSPLIRPTLERTAAMAARDAHRWNIPLRALSIDEMKEARRLLLAGDANFPERCRGIGTHARVTLVWEVQGGHTDPWGLQDQLFQMERFVAMAKAYY